MPERKRFCLIPAPSKTVKRVYISHNLKISGPQQGWPRPLPGAILIPPALLLVADFRLFFGWCQFGLMNRR